MYGPGRPKPTWGDAKSAVEVLQREKARFRQRRDRREGGEEEYRTVEAVLGRIGVEGNESEEGRLGTAWVWWGHMYDLDGMEEGAGVMELGAVVM